MAKVRCVWVDGPTSCGYVPGMVFEKIESGHQNFFVRGKLLWARKKDLKNIKKGIGRCPQEVLPFNGNLWRFEIVE